MNYLGIDFGTVRIGLAIGNDVIKIAMPFSVVENLEKVLEVIKTEGIDKLIIGVPFTMQSESGKMQKQVADFIRELKEVTDLPIIEIDERLSSKAADALVGDKKTKAGRDALAAMLILQNYLDRT
ncbi:MAG: Holliday junction resolvase RuvX [bacterium]